MAKHLIYIWQMSDGRWHISARYRNPAQSLATGMALNSAGLDRGFASRAEAAAALASSGLGVV